MHLMTICERLLDVLCMYLQDEMSKTDVMSKICVLVHMQMILDEVKSTRILVSDTNIVSREILDI